MGYNSWGCKESYTAEQLTLSLSSLDKLVNCFPGDTFAASAAATKLRLSLVTPWIVALQAPLSMGFPRQEYWNGLPFPPPGDLPNLGIKPMSPALADGFFTTEPPWKASWSLSLSK